MDYSWIGISRAKAGKAGEVRVRRAELSPVLNRQRGQVRIGRQVPCRAGLGQQRRQGARFQAIDLRWGVTTEAQMDQQAMNICLREIERCQQLSPRPNFIVLLGNIDDASTAADVAEDLLTRTRAPAVTGEAGTGESKRAELKPSRTAERSV